MKSNIGRGRWKWEPNTLVPRVNGRPSWEEVGDTLLFVSAGPIGNGEGAGS